MKNVLCAALSEIGAHKPLLNFKVSISGANFFSAKTKPYFFNQIGQISADDASGPAALGQKRG